ncbi:MAG: hypothetical protein JEY99_03120 [Spirochaetales bacterium]|nr:hypothetical protein [Spirochaetales bacterium]
MRKIQCHCDNIVESDFPESINLDINPEYREQIMEGTFQSIKCDLCGSILKPELSVRLISSENGLDLFFIAEKERNEYLFGEKNCPAPRLVIGFPELLEKLKLNAEGINDGAIEALKYYLRKKAGSDEISILFDHRESDQLIFHIIGLREDEIAVSRIPISVYNDTLETMKKNSDSELFRLILTPPYISSSKISVLEEE